MAELGEGAAGFGGGEGPGGEGADVAEAGEGAGVVGVVRDGGELGGGGGGGGGGDGLVGVGMRVGKGGGVCIGVGFGSRVVEVRGLVVSEVVLWWGVGGEDGLAGLGVGGWGGEEGGVRGRLEHYWWDAGGESVGGCWRAGGGCGWLSLRRVAARWSRHRVMDASVRLIAE